MGRHKKVVDVEQIEDAIVADPLDGVSRADLPAMLAQAKRDGDAELVARILQACSQ